MNRADYERWRSGTTMNRKSRRVFAAGEEDDRERVGEQGSAVVCLSLPSVRACRAGEQATWSGGGGGEAASPHRATPQRQATSVPPPPSRQRPRRVLHDADRAFHYPPSRPPTAPHRPAG
ncbi:unnamed protein product [Lampetra fluviatilis]